MNGSIRFYQALCGDCISISWYGSDDLNHHIIIDAGFSGTYLRTLGGFLKNLQHLHEKVDLFVVTHTDNDHIGGIRPFIKGFGNEDLVKEFWFNWSNISFKLTDSDTKISMGQAIELRTYLLGIKKLKDMPVVAGMELRIAGVQLKVLSPDEDRFRKFRTVWGKKEKILTEKTIDHKISAERRDDHLSIGELISRPFVEDTATENGSSIAFLFEFGKFSALFLADAHPSVIVVELHRMGYSQTRKLRVNIVKVAHHGSTGNTSRALLEMIECDHFIVSVNGQNGHNLPNKEALARIICRPSGGAATYFFFTYRHPNLENIFPAEETTAFNINSGFPPPGQNHIRFNFSSNGYFMVDTAE